MFLSNHHTLYLSLLLTIEKDIILFPNAFGHGISNDRMKKSFCMHIHGGRLDGINITDYLIWIVCIITYRFNQLKAHHGRTLRGCPIDSWYLLSKLFQTSECIACHSNPSLLCSSWCHHISLDYFEHRNNLCILSFNWNYLMTAVAIVLPLFFPIIFSIIDILTGKLFPKKHIVIGMSIDRFILYAQTLNYLSNLIERRRKFFLFW